MILPLIFTCNIITTILSLTNNTGIDSFLVQTLLKLSQCLDFFVIYRTHAVPSIARLQCHLPGYQDQTCQNHHTLNPYPSRVFVHTMGLSIDCIFVLPFD